MPNLRLHEYVANIHELIRNQRQDAAVAHCLHILRLHPKHLQTYYLLGEAMPASLLVELGILEPQAAERLESLPNAQVRAEFLRDQASKIHYFQQRIELRSAERLLPKL